MCHDEIVRHVDIAQLKVIEEAEQSERELLANWRAVVTGEARP